MQKKLLLIIIMATWMVVGCETVRTGWKYYDRGEPTLTND